MTINIYFTHLLFIDNIIIGWGFCRIYSRADLVGFLQFLEKKRHIKFMFPRQKGYKKIDPRISANFFKWSIRKNFWQQHWSDMFSVPRILTKTGLRNRLCEESLDNLITISIIEGGPLSKLDFHEACQVWHMKKNRRVKRKATIWIMRVRHFFP